MGYGIRDMGYGYDVAAGFGGGGGQGGLDGWQAGWSCGWEEREAAASFAGLAQKESMSMVVSVAREGFFLHLIYDLEGVFPSCFAFIV